MPIVKDSKGRQFMVPKTAKERARLKTSMEMKHWKKEGYESQQAVQRFNAEQPRDSRGRPRSFSMAIPMGPNAPAFDSPGGRAYRHGTRMAKVVAGRKSSGGGGGGDVEVSGYDRAGVAVSPHTRSKPSR